MRTKTALLIFARTASEESKHKTFKASEALFDYQNKQVLKLAKTSGLDYFWIDEHKQRGENFAHRYLNAIQGVFDKGFEQVISIGNDTPELNLNHLQCAVKSLDCKDMCFGPSRDGGFYLWGVKKSFFNKEKYLHFSWKTKDLLSEILLYLEQQSFTVDCISTLMDLDYREDAISLLQKSRLTFQIKVILFQILNQNQNNFTHSSTEFITFSSSVYYNKGSPFGCLNQRKEPLTNYVIYIYEHQILLFFL
ncbi:TIGR04282 family arsenosugar biosynthesis glycosyltransferase [Psychroflexus aestuariivivens]|uniref:TIGR04282 family arsenosugar biosynthesis glycosyltransferase n=1 Tax=Psychroflexus aestuariivivens TaxID=1795040 RepID=UPI000FD887EC|nr:DUF2064 domain-containing protein [Psychroflexus aestuariivivens]